MKTESVKVNLNHIKEKVFKQYFKYRDIFYRMLIADICIYGYLSGKILENTILEDSGYNQFFIYIANKRLSLEEILIELNIIQELSLYLDISLYVSDFIRSRHSDKHINIYGLSITDQCFLLVYNKKIEKEDYSA